MSRYGIKLTTKEAEVWRLRLDCLVAVLIIAGLILRAASGSEPLLQISTGDINIGTQSNQQSELSELSAVEIVPGAAKLLENSTNPDGVA